jgi:hypothetical protein
MRLWVWLAVGGILLVPLCGRQVQAQQRIIYDDDCSNDVDCVATLPILYALADRGEVRILAMVADSANPLSAPVLKLFCKIWGASGDSDWREPDRQSGHRTMCEEPMQRQQMDRRAGEAFRRGRHARALS